MVYRYSMVAARMTENSEFGDYVLYSDYAALQAKLTEAEGCNAAKIAAGREIKRLSQRIEELEGYMQIYNHLSITEIMDMLDLTWDEASDYLLAARAQLTGGEDGDT